MLSIGQRGLALHTRNVWSGGPTGETSEKIVNDKKLKILTVVNMGAKMDAEVHFDTL